MIRSRDFAAGKKQQTPSMVFILAAILGPLALAYALISMDMRNDLTSLKPKQRAYTDGAILLSWADLDPDSVQTTDVHSTPAADNRQIPPTLSNQRVRIAGYMMDGYKPVPDGTLVKMFVLMPDAGQLFHPAHRVAAQMVEVWPVEGTIRYANRSLVWASGLLQRGNPRAGMAEYVLTSAIVEPSSESDLNRWFRP